MARVQGGPEDNGVLVEVRIGEKDGAVTNLNINCSSTSSTFKGNVAVGNGGNSSGAGLQNNAGNVTIFGVAGRVDVLRQHRR